MKFDKNEEQAMDKAIQGLLDNGVLELCKPEKGQHLSSVFARPKPDGSRRLIFNMKPLNLNIVHHKFKMDTLAHILSLVKKDCVMAVVDIKDAYYSVPIKLEYRKYLRFKWKGRLMQYTCLPNGLKSAPRIFTKIMKPPMATLREQGHTVSSYIDDIYIQADTNQECADSIVATKELFAGLGFEIHPGKSATEGSTKTKVLGFVIDSQTMTVRLAPEKALALKQLCADAYSKSAITIREMASVIGKIVAAFPGSQYGQLHYRTLEKQKVMALKRNKGKWDSLMSITPSMKPQLKWWIDNIESQFAIINRNTPDIVLETDASMSGWGARCGTTSTGGRFSPHEQRQALNINALELLAVKLALMAFKNELAAKHVLIRSDNTTAVAYINNKGGMKSTQCDRIAHEIWAWAIENEMWLTATYLPGTQNVQADRESRVHNDRTEWALTSHAFAKICAKFGRPEIDLFASRLNHKVDTYCSWKPDPSAISVDAFTIPWSNKFFFAFPPFSLLARTLQKIHREGASGVIVAPVWPTQVWYPALMRSCRGEPVYLNSTDLYLPHRPTQKHPLTMKMMACLL